MSRAGNVRGVVGVVGLVGVVALSVAGCSSESAAPATTMVEPTVVVTTSPPSTDPPTADPTTTVAPTTTLDPAALAAQVEADFREADRLGREALMDPSSQSKEDAALARRLGVIADNFRGRLLEYRSGNLAIRPNPAAPASITVEVPAALVSEGADVAQLQICEVDSWVVVEVGAGPNGEDAVVNPDIMSYRSAVFLRDVDGIWRFEGGSELGRWEGANGCPGL